MAVQKEAGFSRAFLPGLVLGLVIGAFAGATLPPILAGKKLPDHRPPGEFVPDEGLGERDRQPPAASQEEVPPPDVQPTEPPADDPGAPEGGQPAPQDADEPGGGGA